MAKEPELNLEEVVVEETPQPKSPRLYILLGLVSLVLLQVLGLAWMLPALTKVEKIDPNVLPPPYAMTDPGKIAETPLPDLVEKELGERFSVQDFSPNAQGEIQTFDVKVIVAVEKKDAAKYDELHLQRSNAIRQDVGAVLRASTVQERSQETLGTIRNRIRVKINERLGANYVKDVICTDAKLGSM